MWTSLNYQRNEAIPRGILQNHKPFFLFVLVEESSKMAQFVAPVIHENPDGWGPCAMPQQFKDIPYQPFSKGDRIGKVG